MADFLFHFAQHPNMRSHYVEYFKKALHPELFIKPLIQTADIVVQINSGDRTLGKIRQAI